jgi:hypothetical protein
MSSRSERSKHFRNGMLWLGAAATAFILSEAVLDQPARSAQVAQESGMISVLFGGVEIIAAGMSSRQQQESMASTQANSLDQLPSPLPPPGEPS